MKWTFVLCGLCAAAMGATVTVPGAWTSTSGTSEPLPILTNSTFRDQELIGPEQFGSGTALLITKIGFRAFPGSGPLSATITNLTVHLSTSPLFPNSDNGRTQMSTTYADNIGPDATLVFSGAAGLNSSGCAGPSPCPFDQVLTLTTPFLYNPALGSLLVDLQYTGYTATAGSLDGALFPLLPAAPWRTSPEFPAPRGPSPPSATSCSLPTPDAPTFSTPAASRFQRREEPPPSTSSRRQGAPGPYPACPIGSLPAPCPAPATPRVTFQVGPNSGADQTTTLTIAGLSFNVAQQGPVVNNFVNLIGSMPHIAAEENWTTTFTLVNKGTTPATDDA